MIDFLVERRGSRSGWGCLWLILLVLVTGAAIAEIIRLLLVHDQITRASPGIAAMILSSIVSNAMLRTAIIWAAAAVPLAALVYITRGPRILIPLSEIASSGGRSSKVLPVHVVWIIQAISIAAVLVFWAGSGFSEAVLKQLLRFYACTIPICIVILLIGGFGPPTESIARRPVSGTANTPRQSTSPHGSGR